MNVRALPSTSVKVPSAVLRITLSPSISALVTSAIIFVVSLMPSTVSLPSLADIVTSSLSLIAMESLPAPPVIEMFPLKALMVSLPAPPSTAEYSTSL